MTRVILKKKTETFVCFTIQIKFESSNKIIMLHQNAKRKSNESLNLQQNTMEMSATKMKSMFLHHQSGMIVL